MWLIILETLKPYWKYIAVAAGSFAFGLKVILRAKKMQRLQDTVASQDAEVRYNIKATEVANEVSSDYMQKLDDSDHGKLSYVVVPEITPAKKSNPLISPDLQKLINDADRGNAKT